MNKKPSRRNFASVCADAYVSQYITGRGRVMNQVRIDFNHGTRDFESHSTLTPSGDNDTECFTMEDGCFGDTGHNAKEARSAIYHYILHGADDLWREVVDVIEAGES